MSARPIGQIIAPIVERAKRLSALHPILTGLSSATQRKRLILAAYENDIISPDDCRLLIEAYGLETA